MANCSSLKRRHQSDEAAPAGKRSKSDERLPEIVSLKLNDLNIFCLENIFKYLSLSELFNLVEACGHFVGEAQLAVKRKFRGKIVKIIAKNITIVDDEYVVDRFSLEKRKKSTFSKFFLYFGHLIEKLTVDHQYEISDDFHKAIESHILKHCNKTLLELNIEMINPYCLVLNGITEPFEILQRLNINGGCLERINKFNKWFPQLNSLKLSWNIVPETDANCIHVNFPQLKELAVHDPFYGYIEKTTHFKLFNIKEAIRNNPQLHSLSIRDDCGIITLSLLSKPEFVQFVDEHLKQLNHLEIPMFFDEFNANDCKTIKNIKSLTTRYIPDIKFTALEELQLIQMEEDFDEFFDFINENNELVKLTVKLNHFSGYILNDKDISKLIKSLPKLSAVNIDWDVISEHGLVQFLDECKTLKEFRLFMYANENGKRFLDAKIGQEWKVQYKRVEKHCNNVIEFIRKETV